MKVFFASAVSAVVSLWLGFVIGRIYEEEPNKQNNYLPPKFSYSFTGQVVDVRDDGYAMIKMEKVVGVKLKWTVPHMDDFEAGKKMAVGRSAIVSTQLKVLDFINGIPDSMEAESVTVEGSDLIAHIQNATITQSSESKYQPNQQDTENPKPVQYQD